MGQDIRELLKQDKGISLASLSEGHEERFLAKLDEKLPQQKRKISLGWLKIAASVLVILSVSLTALNFPDSIQNADMDTGKELLTTKNATIILPKENSKLAEISPDYKKAENFYLTSIKNELSEINVNDTNRELVESFMKRLENLDKEYQQLHNELIVLGPNFQNIEAMMENLSLRLSLLKRLKTKIKELDKIQDEDYYDIQI